MLIRDEVANMVWGVERTVPLATGERQSAGSRPRGRRARSSRRSSSPRSRTAPPPPAVPAAAPIRYQVMSTVPENWIPFIPVHVDGNNREIQLQRAALPRILDGDPRSAGEGPAAHRAAARGSRPHAGRAVLRARGGGAARRHACSPQAYQRTRWTDGRVYSLAARTPTDRPRRGHERARLRPTRSTRHKTQAEVRWRSLDHPHATAHRSERSRSVNGHADRLRRGTLPERKQSWAHIRHGASRTLLPSASSCFTTRLTGGRFVPNGAPWPTNSLVVGVSAGHRHCLASGHRV